MMMKIRRKLIVAVTSAALGVAALAGCSTSSGTDTSSAAATAEAVSVSGSQTAQEVMAANQTDHVDGDQSAYTESEVVDVKLSGSTASAEGDGVKVDGSTVTITQGGTYRLSGSLTGQVVITAPDATVKLILNNATISSTTTAAIAATDAKLVTVVLADGSQNSLSDASSYADDADVNAALFSAADLTITGSGALTVKGNGNDGIASKDGLVIQAGTITVSAKDDGVRGKDYVVIDGGTVTVTSGGDGLKADNDTDADRGYISQTGGTVKVTAAGGDGLDASTDLVVTGGTLTVASGGGSGQQPSDDTSTKGLKSNVITVLDGGTISVDSSDDAVHSDGAVHFSGATVSVASGDDGVHSEGDLIVDKGKVEVTKSNEGLEGKNITVNGGDVSVKSSDDGINASGNSGTTSGGGGMGPGGGGGENVGDYSVTINGGTVVIDSQGDGFDSNGTAKMTGGTLVVNGPTMNGNGALDVNGTFDVSGGVILAAGSAGMVVAPEESSSQGWLSATFDSAVAAGTTVQVVDSSGKVLATFVTSKTVQNIVYSSSAIKSGSEYKIYTGGSASGSSIGGLRESGSLGSATAIATVTADQAPAGGGFGHR